MSRTDQLPANKMRPRGTPQQGMTGHKFGHSSHVLANRRAALGAQPLFVGSIEYIASLSVVSWAFFTSHYTLVPACIFVFIAAHAVGQGAVIWVLISEVFPTQHRAQGQTLGSFTHWAMAAMVTSVFPSLVAAFAPGYVFAFFCAMMILQLLWVQTMVVETKGLTLEAVSQRLSSVCYSGA